nr:immunoglobulin light chain junction region [Macaca mulatta]
DYYCSSYTSSSIFVF